MSVLTRGSFQILRLYQGAKHVAMKKLLCLEIRGWSVLDFNGNPVVEEEVEWQRDRSLRTELVRHDWEYLSITQETGVDDPQQPILAKVFSLLEILQLGGSYELAGL